jgi:hypothetical protein
VTHADSHIRVASLAGNDAALAAAALEVLDRNWMGHATSPGNLYPHQWSWDAASIAMGRAAWDQTRAETELRSLFAAQWSTGLVPHIVFTESQAYFPGPAFWQTDRSPNAPQGRPTSGILQPPIHATATWRVYQRSTARRRARAFIEEMFPRLVRWHRYLYEQRTRNGGGLVEVWHPWESGMDNSPAWDQALQRIELSPDQIPYYERIDDKLGDPSQRPTTFDYDRYTYLVDLFRNADYDDTEIRERNPFVIQPVLLNSLLIQADRDLAKIAGEVGEDPATYRAWAELTTNAFDKLWDEKRGGYVDFDVRANARVQSSTGATYAPLFAEVPDRARADRLVAKLAASRARLGSDLWGVPSVDTDQPQFNANLYWRGPVWPIHQWTAYQGAAKYGHSVEADNIRRSTLELARRSGIWEHYDPLTGQGQGDPTFAWTAGLLLDMLISTPDEDTASTEDPTVRA